MTKPENRRFELRAYESPDASRFAAIMGQLLEDCGGKVPRDMIALRWAERYPQHTGTRKALNIRSRMRRVVNVLDRAGVIDRIDDMVVVADRTLFDMVVANLSILEYRNGTPVPSVRWEREPAVPEHLRPVQEAVRGFASRGK